VKNIKIGDKFGNWVVIDYAEDRFEKRHGKQTKTRRKYWKCRCTCGYCDNVVREVIEKNMINGQSKGCGKKHRIENGHKNKRYNEYDLSGDFGIGYFRNGGEFYFDKEDYDLIKDHCWCLLGKKDKYVMTNFKKKENKRGYDRVFLHNLVMDNLDKSKVIDHINGELNDNRKEKLRECTHNENMFNTKHYISNTSGCKGVHYSMAEKKWKAYITHKKERCHLGTFKKMEDAVQARKEAEIKYFGEFTRDEEYL